jgi:hypothetical protein
MSFWLCRQLLNCLAHKFKTIVRFNAQDVDSFHGHCTTRDIYQFLQQSTSLGDVIGLTVRCCRHLLMRRVIMWYSASNRRIDWRWNSCIETAFPSYQHSLHLSKLPLLLPAMEKLNEVHSMLILPQSTMPNGKLTIECT